MKRGTIAGAGWRSACMEWLCAVVILGSSGAAFGASDEGQADDAMPLPPGGHVARFTLTAGGGGVQFPDTLGVEKRGPALGGILGFTLSPHFALEFRGSTASADARSGGGSGLDVSHGEANLTWFLADNGRFAPYVTAGAGGIRMHSENAAAVNGGGGFLIRLSDQFGLRADARDVAFRVPGFDTHKVRHMPELFGGLFFGLGASAKDGDQDGVPDKRDLAPDTPLGARVDVSGRPIDGDIDGIFDGLDRCPGTPPGATVDGSGCPRDSDGDIVLDGLDQCADTPLGARVDPKGCPYDADHDGVMDGLDLCEATPAGCEVDQTGCTVDSDHDGVCDGIDRCPDTPASARVDRHGCPIVVSQKETELLETGMIRLQNVNFQTGKAVIDAESYAVLDEVGAILVKWTELRVEIGGHTDARGSDPQNQKLSEARARAVLDYLMTHFPDLSPEQFTAIGYGESHPIADNGSELGMAKNRRVEFKVLNKEALRRQSEQKMVVPRD